MHPGENRPVLHVCSSGCGKISAPGPPGKRGGRDGYSHDSTGRGGGAILSLAFPYPLPPLLDAPVGRWERGKMRRGINASGGLRGFMPVMVDPRMTRMVGAQHVAPHPCAVQGFTPALDYG